MLYLQRLITAVIFMLLALTLVSALTGAAYNKGMAQGLMFCGTVAPLLMSICYVITGKLLPTKLNIQ